MSLPFVFITAITGVILGIILLFNVMDIRVDLQMLKTETRGRPGLKLSPAVVRKTGDHTLGDLWSAAEQIGRPDLKRGYGRDREYECDISLEAPDGVTARVNGKGSTPEKAMEQALERGQAMAAHWTITGAA